jgi:hypothetical protein
MNQAILKPAVTFEKVTKRYGGITAVDAIDF